MGMGSQYNVWYNKEHLSCYDFNINFKTYHCILTENLAVKTISTSSILSKESITMSTLTWVL